MPSASATPSRRCACGDGFPITSSALRLSSSARRQRRLPARSRSACSPAALTSAPRRQSARDPRSTTLRRRPTPSPEAARTCGPPPTTSISSGRRSRATLPIEASVQFGDSQPAGGTPDPHRKACLIIRQSLDSNAVYADAARHGDGLTSLQWRDAPGAVTHEVQSNGHRSDPAPAGEARQLRVDVDCRSRRTR